SWNMRLQLLPNPPDQGIHDIPVSAAMNLRLAIRADLGAIVALSTDPLGAADDQHLGALLKRDDRASFGSGEHRV
ncbi:MAG: hypothetical protein VX785_06025, partial [Actinomycetota bacterium]|nr:hypothetical protein [Actinomycetota bacterium]